MDSTKPGARLGKYSLVAEIARGGMGIVYLAQAIGRHGFKKLVVVKQLKPELAEDEKFRAMFLDEARLAARLNHRNIVQTMEVDEDAGRYFFVMEYLDGRTLHAASRLTGERALPVSTLLWILCDVLAGLHYAHELTDYDGKPLGVVHRDVSPRNIFLTYDGQVKLLDFGVAKAAGRDQETEVGELKGRVPYMAPEHVGDKTVDRRADIFSVGVLLREALTKVRVWEGSNEIDILSKLIRGQIPPLPADVAIPDEARAILEKAMSFDRDGRYRTAHEMRSALERFVSRIDRSRSFVKLGDHISREFAEQRAHVKAMIEDHVALAESLPPPKSAIPSLPMSSGDLPAAPSSSALASKAEPPSSPEVAPKAPASSPEAAPKPPASRPEAPAAPPPRPAASPAKPAGSPPKAQVSRVAPVAKEISLPPPPRKLSAGSYVLLTLGFFGIVAGLTLAILKMNEAPAATNKVPGGDDPPSFTSTTTGRRPSPSTSATTAAEPPSDGDLVEVTLRAAPPIAEIWVDGVKLGQGPLTQKYKRGTRHAVRVTAPGYVPRTEMMSVSSTASLYIDLEREAGAAPVVAPRPARPRSSAAPPSASATAPRSEPSSSAAPVVRTVE